MVRSGDADALDLDDRWSATGPSTTAGMNDKTPTRITVPNSMLANVKLSVRSVPLVLGTPFFFASDPAIASGKTSGPNRFNKSTHPETMFHGGLLSARPSNPEPLFEDAEVNS